MHAYPGRRASGPMGGRRDAMKENAVLEKVLLLMLGGAGGTLARVGMVSLVGRFSPAPLPVGTLVVNGLGCFLFGLVWAVAERRMAMSQAGTVALLAGFIGAFTTFSTFAFETVHLARQTDYAWAAANMVSQNIVGVVMLLLGVAAGRLATGELV